MHLTPRIRDRILIKIYSRELNHSFPRPGSNIAKSTILESYIWSSNSDRALPPTSISPVCLKSMGPGPVHLGSIPVALLRSTDIGPAENLLILGARSFKNSAMLRLYQIRRIPIRVGHTMALAMAPTSTFIGIYNIPKYVLSM